MKSSGGVHEISVSFSGNEVVTQLTGRTVVSVDILAGTDNILGLCVSEFAPVALLPQSLSGLTCLSLPLSLSYPRCPSKVERKIFYPYLQPRSLPLLPAVIASFRFTSSVFPQKGTGEDFLFHQPSTPSIGLIDGSKIVWPAKRSVSVSVSSRTDRRVGSKIVVRARRSGSSAL